MNCSKLLVLSFVAITSLLLTPNAVLATVSNESLPAHQNVMLFGKAENTPDLHGFWEAVRDSVDDPCAVMPGLSRLMNVVYDDQARKLVWKRMKRQEYFWVSDKDLAVIEKLADENGLSLN